MYKDNVYWKMIEGFLPEENRITSEKTPKEKWYSLKGMKIRYDEYFPKEKSDTSIVMLHGVGGNGRLLSFLAVPLVDAGYHVICPDLPGYGYTETEEDFDYSLWIDMGEYVVNREQEKGRKVFLFGLSAGGMLAYNVACRVGSLHGLMLSTILDNRYQIVRDYSAKNRFHSRVGIKVLAALPPFIQRVKIPVKGVANTRKIVNRKDLLKIMLKDKTGSGSSVSIKFIISMMNMIPLIEPEDFSICPVLLAHPGDDRWTPVEISRLFFDRIKADKKVVILENAGHFPVETPGLQQLSESVIDFIRHR